MTTSVDLRLIPGRRSPPWSSRGHTAGGERLHLSLPSASARIRALEHHAGVALLERGRRGVRPTPAGIALARHAGEVLDDLVRLEGAVAGYRRPAGTPLVLLAGSSPMRRLVPRALVTFLVAHPDVDVVTRERRSADSVRALADGEADLGVSSPTRATPHPVPRTGSPTTRWWSWARPVGSRRAATR